MSTAAPRTCWSVSSSTAASTRASSRTGRRPPSWRTAPTCGSSTWTRPSAAACSWWRRWPRTSTASATALAGKSLRAASSAPAPSWRCLRSTCRRCTAPPAASSHCTPTPSSLAMTASSCGPCRATPRTTSAPARAMPTSRGRRSCVAWHCAAAPATRPRACCGRPTASCACHTSAALPCSSSTH